jgi:hypothetical protein
VQSCLIQSDPIQSNPKHAEREEENKVKLKKIAADPTRPFPIGRHEGETGLITPKFYYHGTCL